MRLLRWRCDNCQWLGMEAELLKAPNPFDADDSVTGCPECKSVGEFTNICDEPGCELEAGCGFPTDSGYRRTCFKHSCFLAD